MNNVVGDGSHIHELLRAIEARTGQAISAGREVTRIGVFIAALHPTSDLVWFNFAVPDSRCTDRISPGQIADLRAHFQARGRRLRFEFFEALWPDLGGLLEECGLRLEGRMPLMICTPGDLRPLVVPNVQIRELADDADDALIAEFLATGRRGFGMDPPAIEPSDIEEQKQHLQAGVYRCAYAEVQGTMTGVGSLSQINDELAGIATLPGFRRRGIAASLSSHLVERHFSVGRSHVWLSAGDDAARAVYHKIGFRSAGVQLNYSDPCC